MKKPKPQNKKSFSPNTYSKLQNNIKNLPTPKIETVDNNYADRQYTVNIDFPEFTCVCPKTGLPDFANIKIEYIPNQLIIELKSLKLYFISFRNVGIFHENVVNKILDDLVIACNPRVARVVGEFGVRGGIKTTVTASYPGL